MTPEERDAYDHLIVTENETNGKFNLFFEVDDEYAERTRFGTFNLAFNTEELRNQNREDSHIRMAKLAVSMKQEPADSDSKVKNMVMHKFLFGIFSFFKLEFWDDPKDTRSYVRIGRLEAYTHGSWANFRVKYDSESMKNPIFMYANANTNRGTGIVFSKFFNKDAN